MAIKLAQSTIGHDPKKNTDADPADHPTELRTVLPLVKEHGYDGVEIWEPHVSDMDEAGLREVRSQLDDLGLDLPMLSGYFKFTRSDEQAAEGLAEAHRVLAEARILGAAEIRVFTGGDRSGDATPEMWDRGIRCLQELADAAAPDDINICLHTHDWNLVDTIDGTLKTVELVDRPNCTVLLKPAYFAPAEHWTLEHLGHATSCVQVTQTAKDSYELADGTIDWRAHMLWFLQRDQDVWFSFTCMGEDARGHGRTAFPYLDQCRRDAVARVS